MGGADDFHLLKTPAGPEALQTYLLCLTFTTSSWGSRVYPQFADEETKAQRKKVVCSKSQCKRQRWDERNPSSSTHLCWLPTLPGLGFLPFIAWGAAFVISSSALQVVLKMHLVIGCYLSSSYYIPETMLMALHILYTTNHFIVSRLCVCHTKLKRWVIIIPFLHWNQRLWEVMSDSKNHPFTHCVTWPPETALLFQQAFRLLSLSPAAYQVDFPQVKFAVPDSFEDLMKRIESLPTKMLIKT